MLEVSKNFLKNQYQYWLNKNDGCNTHSTEYALNKTIPIKIWTEVSKSLKGVFYHGRVIGYESKEELYKIRYDDNNEEEMYKEELQEFIIEKNQECDCNACKFPNFHIIFAMNYKNKLN